MAPIPPGTIVLGRIRNGRYSYYWGDRDRAYLFLLVN